MVTKSELEEKARELGIKNVKKMTKEQLMELLRRRGASVEGKRPKATPKRVVRDARPQLTSKQREEMKRRQMVSNQNLQQRNQKMAEMKQAAQKRLNANQSRPQPVSQRAKMAEIRQKRY